jgi:superfamily II DNA or RNA helicase
VTVTEAPHVRLTLRPYQLDVLDRIDAAEARGVRKQLVVMATGTGKTICFAGLAERRGCRTLILAHRDELVSQAAAKVREVWPGVSVGVVKASRNEVDAHVVVASVQTLARAQRLAQLIAPFADDNRIIGRVDPFGLVVVDEAHHTAADSYRGILDALRAGHPADPIPDEPEFDVDPEPAGPLLLGVTATPDRGDGKGLDDLFDEIVASYDVLWGIRSGFLADLRGIRVTVTGLDMDDVRTRHGDFDQGQAGRLMEEAGADVQVVRAWKEHALGRRTLVFTPTVAMAELVASAFAAEGIDAGWVHGGTPLEERRRILADYSAGRITVLANCAVLTEGYDEPRTDCIVVARPTKSRALYCFDAATEVLTPAGWVPGNTVAEGATIAAFDPADGAVRWEPVLAHVERPLLPGERMMALRSPSIDVRVTDTHRMVWRARHGRARERGPWNVSLAGELAERADVWDLPVAGVEKAEGVPLSDADLAFIGWVQTDGCFNRANGAIQISQQYPDQRAHIEATLDACGFKWRVSENAEPTAYGPRRYPLATYRISRGAPRGDDKHLTGLGRLGAWVPKADPAAWSRLEAMDARQWAVFLDAWHRGDGAKQAGQTWTRRGYHLSIADEWTAGWVQAMCMRRGWRANVARSGTVWIVHCREGVARYVGGASSTDRPRLIATPELPGELVWCVSVPSGAILTRRNGKGAIVGQTQMVGRGTRRHPDKTDCLVLDMVGATTKHSLVTIPSLFGLENEYAERMGDGSGSLAGVVDDRDQELVRLGKLRAEEADLFHRVRAEGIAWVQVHRDGDPLKRYVRPLGKGEDGYFLPTVVLAQRQPDADVWTAGLLAHDGAKSVLIAEVSMEMAQGVADDYVRRHGRARITQADAAWRKAKPSPNQLVAAKKWRMKVDPAWTAGDLSEHLDAHIARIKHRSGSRP